MRPALSVFLLVRLVQIFGDFAVGEKHVFLDELVRVEALLDEHFERLAVLVEAEFYLVLLEIDRAVVELLLLHDFGDVVEGAKLVLVVSAINRELRVLVGESSVGIDDRLAEPAVADLGFVIYDEYGGEGELVFVRIERTDVVREHFRKHGDRAVDEIYGKAPLLRLLVELGSRTDIMRDVGDVHADLVPAGVRALELLE